MYRQCGSACPAHTDLAPCAHTWQEGEEAARKARLRAENAAQMAADARKLMHKVLDDTTTLLGLTADLD
jgi:hypothetical protein